MKEKEVLAEGCLVRIYPFELIDERMYVIKEEKEALVIDPFESEALKETLDGTERVHILLTHEHFDHISGVNWLRNRYDCKVYASKACDEILQSKDNGTSRFPLLFLGEKEKYHYVKQHFAFPYRCGVDVCFSDYWKMEWMGHEIQLFETPGHSRGSISIQIDQYLLFPGDNLLGNGQELKSVGADPALYKERIFPWYEQLDQEKTLVFPGHGEVHRLSWYLDKVRSYLWN